MERFTETERGMIRLLLIILVCSVVLFFVLSRADQIDNAEALRELIEEGR